jgi:hypothetical protein
MKTCIAILTFAGVAFCAHAETKHDKDIAACNKAADAAIAKAKLKHPLDAEEIRKTEVNKCMHGRSYAVGKIRDK